MSKEQARIKIKAAAYNAVAEGLSVQEVLRLMDEVKRDLENELWNERR